MKVNKKNNNNHKGIEKDKILFDISDEKYIAKSTSPKNRWFHTSLSFMITVSSIFLGISVICMIVILR